MKILSEKIFEDGKVSIVKDSDFGLCFAFANGIVNDTLVVNEENFSFIIDHIKKVEFREYAENFEVHFNESLGNNSYLNIHSFDNNDSINQLFFKREYKISHSIQSLEITCRLCLDTVSLEEYKNYNKLNFIELEVFSFKGFQEEKQPTINSYHNIIKSNALANLSDSISIYGNINVIKALTSEISISKLNIQLYNDIAYYFEKYGLFNSSIYLLERIIKKSPSRVVAYINLGDAYWGLHDFSKALICYEKYIELMNAKRLEHKIPKRIVDRVNKKKLKGINVSDNFKKMN